jgi:CheY-like chemotaxis protein
MPVMSGLDVLAKVRLDAHLNHIKIIAYTAFAKVEDVSHLVGLGFDDVLVKPLTSAKLLYILKSN